MEFPFQATLKKGRASVYNTAGSSLTELKYSKILTIISDFSHPSYYVGRFPEGTHFKNYHDDCFLIHRSELVILPSIRKGKPHRLTTIFQ